MPKALLPGHARTGLTRVYVRGNYKTGPVLLYFATTHNMLRGFALRRATMAAETEMVHRGANAMDPLLLAEPPSAAASSTAVSGTRCWPPSDQPPG